MQITKENAWLERDSGAPHVEIPRFMSEIVEEFVRLARTSSHVNQQSGVSVRASITCMETLVSNAERRGILLDESRVMPRVGDLQNVHASCRGKLELMLAEDDLAEEKLITALLGEAVKNVGSNYFELDDLEPVIEKFQGGKVNVEIGDEVAAAAMINTAAAFAPLLDHAGRICEEAGLDAEDPPALASATEFILEALYVNNRLSKYSYRRGTFYKR
jgi:magnesium chelatase subunit I